MPRCCLVRWLRIRLISPSRPRRRRESWGQLPVQLGRTGCRQILNTESTFDFGDHKGSGSRTGARSILRRGLSRARARLAFNDISGIGRDGTGVLILQWDETFDVGADTGTPVYDKTTRSVQVHRQAQQADALD